MKLLLLIAPVILSLYSFAQPFVGIALANHGFALSTGYLSGIGVEVKLQYHTPFVRADLPNILTTTAGYRVVLREANEDDKYSLTPSIGLAHLRVENFEQYFYPGPGTDNNVRTDVTYEEGKIKKISKFPPVLGLELARDLYNGRYFFSAFYCKNMLYTIGMRGYIKRRDH